MEKLLGYPFKQIQRISNYYSLITTPTQSKHEGLDFAAVHREDYREFYGTPVTATHSGEVVLGYSIKGYGLYVYLISEDKTFATVSAHLGETMVEHGSFVEDGDVIGLVGCTGLCKPPGTRGTHLHFGLRFLPAPVDSVWPYGYIDPFPYMRMLS